MKKILIEIPESEYLMISKSDDNAFATMASKEAMMHAIKSGKVLSEMTNGEVYEEVFENFDNFDNIEDAKVYAHPRFEEDDWKGFKKNTFSKTWWNAPYNK